ncbi:mobilization protein [Streptomyces morookaense]|uniref:relaxase/mobilization nuclease domain-containing protein n=1 Tax=Streptomyces morookaense TaxID=1970 RepID=UPI0033DC1709
MVPDVSTGSDTRGLIVYLFGPGRRDEHTDPHIVAAWDMAGAPDPGRDPDATYTQLAQRLDHHVDLRTRELGGRKPPKHVWHCPVRTAPGDRYLTDAEWAEVAHRVIAATGIAPEGDEKACRWIAVRHADDHIHILATTVRADGRRPRTHRDGWRAQQECRKIEAEFGLRRLKSGDLTAPPTPTGAERAKADRQGQSVTARQWLREQAYAVAAAVRTETDYFTVLQSLGIKVKTRLGPETGDVIGYGLAAPGDTNASGEPVWYGGSKLAPDLSINRLRERLAAQTTPDQPTTYTQPASPWQKAETTLRTTGAILDTGDDATAQAHLSAFSELLHTTAMAAPTSIRSELQAAARAFNRANRSAVRADHRKAAALRATAKGLIHAEPGDSAALTLLSTAILITIAAVRWHEQRGHEQQAAAAHQALTHLRTGYRHAAQPVLAGLARHSPRAEVGLRYEADVRQIFPKYAASILADPAWPALTAALAHAETAGHQARHVLVAAAEQRELDTAHSLAEVLNWRIANHYSRHRKVAVTRHNYVSRPRTSHETPLTWPVKSVSSDRRRSRG